MGVSAVRVDTVGKTEGTRESVEGDGGCGGGVERIVNVLRDGRAHKGRVKPCGY